MARLKNVRLRTDRLYTISFYSGMLAFVEFIYFKNDVLKFRVVASTPPNEMLYKGKIIHADKNSFKTNGLSPSIRNITKTEMILYVK